MNELMIGLFILASISFATWLKWPRRRKSQANRKNLRTL